MIKFASVSKAYGARTLLNEASFAMGPGERVALVGRNGSGKSTIFKLILGEEDIDGGEIVIPRGYRVGHLAQHLHFTLPSIVAEVMVGLPPERQDEEYRARIILSGLGFSEDDMELPASHFSGGFQIRVNLARLLLSEPNLLLLDEPTNYLDIISARWLIDFLRDWENEMIMISHDREFLDVVSTHSMLIYRQGLTKMRGKTDDLYSQIEQDEERYERTRVNEDKKRKQVEAFVTRFRAQASKAAQVQSRIKALNRMGEKEELQDEASLEFRFRETPPFHGKYLLEASELSFRYSEKDPLLINNLSLNLAAGERLAIIGKNGRGKSTLLKILAGELSPQKGSVRTSTHARIGYFGQTNINRLNLQNDIEREVTQANDTLSRTEVRAICGAMMFSGDDALKRISVLSGGERSRVLLGKLIAQPSNVLLLDEPTNHLDMESIEALIATCQSYSGAIALVTHSEYILRALATKIIVFGNAGPQLIDGDYDYFLSKVGWEEEDTSGGAKSSGSTAPSASKRSESDLSPEEKKQLKALKRDVKEIEDKIEKLEQQQKRAEVALAEASASGDKHSIVETSRSLAELTKQIESEFERLESADAKCRAFD